MVRANQYLSWYSRWVAKGRADVELAKSGDVNSDFHEDLTV
jgi:hypothetical protein